MWVGSVQAFAEGLCASTGLLLRSVVDLNTRTDSWASSDLVLRVQMST